MRLRNAFERIETEWQYIKKQEFKWEKRSSTKLLKIYAKQIKIHRIYAK